MNLGLKFDLENSKLYFEGKLVRFFDDQWKGDNLNTKGIGYYETHGTVDIKAVRDSNDQLTGLQKATEEEFAAREIPEPTAAEVATVDDPRKVASDYPLHSMIQQKDTDVWTYLKKPIRTLMDRATGMVYFSENGEVNLNVVRNEYGEAQSLETLCDEEVRQELSEYAPEYLFSEDKLKTKKVLNYGEPASWLREEYLSNRHLSFDENGNFLYDDQLVRYFIDGSNSYFSDDFSGDLDEYLKKSEVIAMSTIIRTVSLIFIPFESKIHFLILRHLSQNKQQDGLLKQFKENLLPAVLGMKNFR